MEGNSWAWHGGLSTVVGFAAAGSIGGGFWFVEGIPFGAGELVALLVVCSSLASMIALMLPLRRAITARVVAATAAWAAVAGFFGTSIALSTAPLPRETLLVLVGVAPLVAGTIACAGAAYLARGIRRARARRTPS